MGLRALIAKVFRGESSQQGDSSFDMSGSEPRQAGVGSEYQAPRHSPTGTESFDGPSDHKSNRVIQQRPFSRDEDLARYIAQGGTEGHYYDAQIGQRDRGPEQQVYEFTQEELGKMVPLTEEELAELAVEAEEMHMAEIGEATTPSYEFTPKTKLEPAPRVKEQPRPRMM